MSKPTTCSNPWTRPPSAPGRAYQGRPGQRPAGSARCRHLGGTTATSLVFSGIAGDVVDNRAGIPQLRGRHVVRRWRNAPRRGSLLLSHSSCRRHHGRRRALALAAQSAHLADATRLGTSSLDSACFSCHRRTLRPRALTARSLVHPPMGLRGGLWLRRLPLPCAPAT